MVPRILWQLWGALVIQVAVSAWFPNDTETNRVRCLDFILSGRTPAKATCLALATLSGYISLYPLHSWDGETRQRISNLPEQLKLVFALLQILCKFLCDLL